jgi:hypothetical protein
MPWLKEVGVRSWMYRSIGIQLPCWRAVVVAGT